MVYLFVWVVVAASGNYSVKQYEWANQGAFSRQECPKAAALLGIPADKFRCVESGR